MTKSNAFVKSEVTYFTFLTKNIIKICNLMKKVINYLNKINNK